MMINASGRSFDNGDIIYSSASRADVRLRNTERNAASAKRYVEALKHRAIIAQEWSVLVDEAVSLGACPKWWRLRSRRRWNRNTAILIERQQIWRDIHKDAV